MSCQRRHAEGGHRAVEDKFKPSVTYRIPARSPTLFPGSVLPMSKA
jgi:hypothetical protein